MDYKNGKIYALRSPHTDQVYIGSTTQPLSKRLYKHKNHWGDWKAGKYHYISSFIILEAGEAYIELVKNCPCDSREELRREEGITMRATQNCCNRFIAGRTQKEYREDNREQRNERFRQYYQENKEELNERNRQYYQENKEQIAENQRQYRQENIERIREQRKEYREKNKEQRKEKIGCFICKSMVRKSNFKRHTETPKHQKNKEDYEEKRFLKDFRKATIEDKDFDEFFDHVQNE